MAKYERALSPGTSLQGGEYSYRIDRVLGQGSFGITYLAYARVTIGGKLGKLQGEMPVAVKEFFMRDINGRDGSTVTLGSEGGLFDKYRHKFSREARNLAGLDHPGIVKVLETFEANGTSYYSMEYCGGGSLDALIAERGCLSQDDALRYFGQMADALDYMHGRHMLHLDLKPGNVMLRTSGEAVLIDFGLSKQYDEEGVPESSTTIGGGTPGYAPIEQTNYKEDDSGHLPVTMDIYALGGTLYKMLTGEKPPVASDVLVSFPEKLLCKHGVSDNVVAAIRRAMQPIPANRYQSVATFAEALHCGINNSNELEVTLEKPNPPLEPKPTSKSQRKPKGNALIWAAVAVAALVILVALIPNMHRTSDPDASAQYTGTDTLALVDDSAQVSTDSVPTRDTITVPTVAENNTNDALAQASTESVPSNTILESAVAENNQHRQNAPTVTETEVEAEYNKPLKESNPNAEDVSQEQQLSPTELYLKGKRYYDEGDYVEAVKWCRKAAEQGNVNAQIVLGNCYYNGRGVSCDYAEAVEWYRKAAKKGNASVQVRLGYCYYYGQGVSRDYVEAVKWFRKAAEQGDASAQNRLGYCYYNGQGVSRDYVEAVKWFRKAAEQGDAGSQYFLGYCYELGRGASQDYAEAVKWYCKAAEQGYDRAKERLKKLGYE